MRSPQRALAVCVATLAVVVVSISGYALRNDSPPNKRAEQAEALADQLRPLLEDPRLFQQIKRRLRENLAHDPEGSLLSLSVADEEPDKRGRPMPPLPWDKRSDQLSALYRQARGRAMPPLPWDKRAHLPISDDVTEHDQDARMLEALNTLG